MSCVGNGNVAASVPVGSINYTCGPTSLQPDELVWMGQCTTITTGCLAFNDGNQYW
jgi:hypothetical protein